MKLKNISKISSLFDNIAKRYDFLNRTLSFNTDISWRKKLVKLSGVSKGNKVLDVCTGTGDIEIEFAKSAFADEIFGVIFPGQCLKKGQRR